MENTSTTTPAQAEAPKPLTLSSIEAHLLDKELDHLAGIVWRAAETLDRAIREASGDGHFLSRKPIAEALSVRLSNGWGAFRGDHLKEILTEGGKRTILERITKDFLSRVEEIGQIAEEAASRGEG